MFSQTVGIFQMVCKFLSLLVVYILLITGCASRPWTKEEKQLLGLSCLTTVADMVTTFEGLENGNKELNPIMGEHPSKERVVVVFLYYLSVLPPKHQRLWFEHLRQDKCIMCEAYYTNSILGEFYHSGSLNQALFEEQIIINQNSNRILFFNN